MRVVLGLVTLVAWRWPVYNVNEIIRLRSRGAEVRQQTEAAEREADRLQSEARRIRQTINRNQLAAVQVAAQEANQLIDRRAFSWTDLFNQFEQTLPTEVRIAAVTPQVDPSGRMVVSVAVVSRRVRISIASSTRWRAGAFPARAVAQDEAQEDRHAALNHPGLLQGRRRSAGGDDGGPRPGVTGPGSPGPAESGGPFPHGR